MEVEKTPEVQLLQRERKCPHSRDLVQEFLILSHLPLKISSILLPVLPSFSLFSRVSKSDELRANREVRKDNYLLTIFFFLIIMNCALKKSYQVIILETSTVKITRPLKIAYTERAEASKEPGLADLRIHLLIEGDRGHGGVQAEHVLAEQSLHAQGQAVHIPRHRPQRTRNWSGTRANIHVKQIHVKHWSILCTAMLAARSDQAMKWGVSDGLWTDLGCLRLSSGLEKDMGLFTAYREKQLKIHIPATIPLTGPVIPARLWENKKKYIDLSVMVSYYRYV